MLELQRRIAQQRDLHATGAAQKGICVLHQRLEHHRSGDSGPRSARGVSVGETYPKIGARGTTHSELIFHDAEVPEACLPGQEGKGLPQMMHSLDFIRLLTAAHAIGIAQAAYEEAIAYLLHDIHRPRSNIAAPHGLLRT